MEKTSFFWITLRQWFKQNQRIYPWRNTKNPYHVLIAEFLLQQTHVRKVEEVYNYLLSSFPTVQKLSKASESKLIEIISPIGLIYRAFRIKSTAIQITANFNGKVPDKFDTLIKFPGIGDYIANAVLCYAYNKNTVPIDTNVIRLFIRFFDLKSDKSRPRTDKILASKIRDLYIFNFDFKTANLAVLDFAGIICTTVNPKCIECPLNIQCNYYIKESLL